MTFSILPSVAVDIREHALAAFPEEACGLVVSGVYLPCTNGAADRTKDFVIAGADLVLARSKGVIEAVVHSHPTANGAPSSNDMRAAITSNLPFVIVPCNGDTTGPFVVFGNNVAIPELLGRSFVHGVTDCFSAIRDTYRLGRDAAAAQGFTAWPFDPVAMAEVARDDGWWGEPGKPGADLYTKGFGPAGFRKIAREEVKPGDVFLCKVRSTQFNHGGLLVSPDLIFHHLPGRLSRREPAGVWARAAEQWLRFEGAPA